MSSSSLSTEEEEIPALPSSFAALVPVPVPVPAPVSAPVPVPVSVLFLLLSLHWIDVSRSIPRIVERNVSSVVSIIFT